MQIQPVPASVIHPLRHAVLRAGFPVESAHFDGDDEPTTLHLAAVEDGVVVGCVTMVRRALDGAAGWQLRGMATSETMRGRGVGAALLAEVHRRFDGQLLWCNARIHAVGFYERHGWRCVSDVFDVPTVGPHRRMVRGG